MTKSTDLASFTPNAGALNSTYLDVALLDANWIKETDAAAVGLVRHLAICLDAAIIEATDIKAITMLAGRYLQVLQELHLTVATRITDTKQDEVVIDYAQDYLRLTKAKVAKSKVKIANGRHNSKEIGK